MSFNFNIIATPLFKSQSKRLIKKYPSLKNELATLHQLLSLNPDEGTPLGNNTFKIRLAIRSKGKGKSGGARIITFKINEQKEVYLLTIYDKSEISAVTNQAIANIIEQIQK